MNISAHLCLAVAIGICVISTAYSEQVVSKTYVVKGFNGWPKNGDAFAIKMVIDENDKLSPTSVFPIDSNRISEDYKGFHMKVFPINEVPVNGLFWLVAAYPELLPQVLPTLLAHSNPEVVAKRVLADRYRALKPEEKNLISSEDQAALEKIYALHQCSCAKLIVELPH